MVASMLLVRR
jgi:glycerol-3-phosphate O-acyltransferase